MTAPPPLDPQRSVLLDQVFDEGRKSQQIPSPMKPKPAEQRDSIAPAAPAEEPAREEVRPAPSCFRRVWNGFKGVVTAIGSGIIKVIKTIWGGFVWAVKKVFCCCRREEEDRANGQAKKLLERYQDASAPLRKFEILLSLSNLRRSQKCVHDTYKEAIETLESADVSHWPGYGSLGEIVESRDKAHRAIEYMFAYHQMKNIAMGFKLGAFEENADQFREILAIDIDHKEDKAYFRTFVWKQYSSRLPDDLRERFRPQFKPS